MMKILTTDELRKKAPAELQQELYTVCKELFNLRVQKAVGEVNNIAQFKRLRRYVARIKTILCENAGKNA